ncbi:hypothetical protein [Lacipirellula parvula]|uniref:Uncharacterized protein n=1 Tax=Lacipirellula parvula TaxID=2650471 RepID=A0A5K7XF93_9BACT|nr:hypothetical protein [Lacipirellula parvula]BBO33551.1 hypothetical protein PLANPX_3163 [Lacipirellula parvula]
MTPELQRRWQAASAPFDGMVVTTCDEHGPSILQEMLLLAAGRLQGAFPDVYVSDDWHEHDGFLTEPSPIAWEELLERFASPRALYDSRHQDEHVRVAIFPSSHDWLLRYCIEDSEPDYRDACCDFDFTCSPESPAYGLASQINATWPGYTNVMPAKEFFDRSYGG